MGRGRTVYRGAYTPEVLSKGISSVMNRKGMSARELAAKLGVKTQYVSYVAEGKTIPGGIRLLEIADALEVPVEEFVNRGRKSLDNPSDAYLDELSGIVNKLSGKEKDLLIGIARLMGQK